LLAFFALSGAAMAACPNPITIKDAGGTTQNFDTTVDGSGNCASNSAIVDGSNAGNKATVTAGNALKVDGSAVTQPVSFSGMFTDITGSGTLIAVNNAVTVSTQGSGDTSFVISANTNVTLVAEGSVDGSFSANDVITLTAYPTGGGAGVTSISSGSVGSWTVASAALQKVRVRVTAVGSTPSATVAVDAGAGNAQNVIVVSPTASNFNVTATGTVTANQGGAPWSQNVTQFGGTNISTGTGAGGAGIPRVTVSNDSNVLATQSGSWTVTANAGTNLNTSALALERRLPR
jgi:hypothetical protein